MSENMSCTIGGVKKVQVIGSVLCPDCLLALVKLKEAGINTEFHNITGTMQELKYYLSIRDSEPMFEAVKAKGSVGIPFFIFEDGTKTFDLSVALSKGEAECKGQHGSC